MTGLCYWCESRALIHCKNCKRNFCKFCIKGGHLNDESKCVCFLCGCFELTEVINENSNGYLKDREMYDMLHRYEGLFSNDKLANSIHDLLINIDAIDHEKLPRLFDVIKLNIHSMLHDVQKIETMVNKAINENRNNDIETVLMPLMKVVMKHHVFKRLGRPQHCIANEERVDLSDFRSVYDNPMERLSLPKVEDGDDERMQRSPERLADEDRLTGNFEIQESREDDDTNHVPRESLSLISSQMKQLNKINLELDLRGARNPSSGDVFSTPSKENQLGKRKRYKRSSDIERRSVRLRSESNLVIAPLHPDLSRAMTVFQGGLLSPSGNSSSKSVDDNIKHSEERPSPKSSKSNSRKLSLPMIEIKEEKVCEIPAAAIISNRSPSSSSLSIDNGGRKSDNQLRKFSQIVNRNKNSHLVSPAPTQYERPFVLKDMKEKPSADCLEEDAIKQPVSHKTWSWERSSLSTQNFVIPTKKKSIISDDLSQILRKPVIIPRPIRDVTTIVVPVRGRPRLSSTTVEGPVKRVLSTSADNINDSDEPKKKRGRPRKYFDFACHPGETSNGSREDVRNSSDNLSDGNK